MPLWRRAIIVYIHGIVKAMRAEERLCTTRKNVFSGAETRKCNIRKCAFGRPLNKEASLGPISGFL